MITRRPLLEDHILSEREQKNLAILELIRRRGPITRTEISQGTNLNIVTVSNYIGHYIERNLVTERGFSISTGGRKPTLVELHAEAAYAIGVDLGTLELPAVQMRVLLADLSGRVKDEVIVARPKEGLERVLQRAGDLIQALLDRTKVDRARIGRIAVGVGAVVDETAGTLRDTRPGGERVNYVALRETLEERFEMPVFIANDANLAALGELRFGLTKDVKNMVYMYADAGCGIVINGNLYWGACGSAGEVELNYPTGNDYISWMGKSPYFLAQGIDLGIPAQAKKLLAEGLDTRIRALSEGVPDRVTPEIIFRAAHEGDALAREIIEHAATTLGIRISQLVNLLNPEVVVIGGGVERAGALLMEPLSRTLRRWAFEEPASHVNLAPGQLGDRVVALGAASLVSREIFLQT